MSDCQDSRGSHRTVDQERRNLLAATATCRAPMHRLLIGELRAQAVQPGGARDAQKPGDAQPS
jgi:hypothetical protein